MSYFVVHCLDAPDALPRRLACYEDHKTYLGRSTVRILVSGPLLADDGETMIGSFFLIEAAAKAEVEAFNAGDPFRKSGVWHRIEIHPFHKRVDQR